MGLYRLTEHEDGHSYRADLHDAGMDDDPKSDLFVHLLHDHDVLMTTGEYFDMSLDDMRKLDPCCGGEAA